MEQTGPAEARRLYEIARDKYHELRAAIPEVKTDDNDTAPQQQPEIPTIKPDDDSSGDQQAEIPEKEDDSDSLPQQIQEAPEEKGDDESPQQQPETGDNEDSAPLLQQEIDVEIKPDDQSSSSAPGEGNTSA